MAWSHGFLIDGQELLWLILASEKGSLILFKKAGLQSNTISKVSLFMGPPPKLQREHNGAQQEATESTEATELQGTSQWLRVPAVVASSSLSDGPHQHRPYSVIAAVKKYWRLQVIATIPENECQDHFGTETPSFSFIYISCTISSPLGSNASTIIVKEFPGFFIHTDAAWRSVHAHHR